MAKRSRNPTGAKSYSSSIKQHRKPTAHSKFFRQETYGTDIYPSLPGMSFRPLHLCLLLPLLPIHAELPPLKEGAVLALDETWSSGIDPSKWYVMRRHWGNGHHGVVPENVHVELESIADGGKQPVLICEAHGEKYDGPVKGLWNRGDRVGGVIASKAFFASGRFEVSMRVGGAVKAEDGPEDPTHPIGSIPAIWVFAGWNTRVKPELSDGYVEENPLYQPYLQEYGRGNAYYWSELDFCELGKKGDFSHGLYNTFLHKKTDSQVLPVQVADGQFHTYTTEWRTTLVELKDLHDDQVIEHEGRWWVRDLKVPFSSYWGNSLKKIGPNRYAVHQGQIARHWIDGKFIGENTKFVPCIAAQLSLGVWLPDWAGPAPWKVSRVSFGRVRIWQYGDEGDVKGLLTNDQPDNIGKDGDLMKAKP